MCRYVRNPVKERWYLMNDTSVSPESTDSVMSSDAYVLFYQSEVRARMSEVLQ